MHEKSNTLEGILSTFFRKISVGMNRSNYFPTGTIGFSLQMVSAPHRNHITSQVIISLILSILNIF